MRTRGGEDTSQTITAMVASSASAQFPKQEDIDWVVSIEILTHCRRPSTNSND